MSGERETELCFYGKVADPSGYDQAIAVEEHEQWERKLDNGSKIRVRKTTKENASAYEQTIKSHVKNDAGLVAAHIEHTVDITEAHFEAWRKTVAENGCKKIRYTFLTKACKGVYKGQEIVIPEHQFEVDVMLTADGQRSAWVKIDVEIDKLLDYLEEHYPGIGKIKLSVGLSDLPLKLEKSFEATTTDPEERKIIETFWNQYRLDPHAVSDPAA